MNAEEKRALGYVFLKGPSSLLTVGDDGQRSKGRGDADAGGGWGRAQSNKALRNCSRPFTEDG